MGIATGGYENQSCAYKVYETLRIVATDILPSNFTCILPNALSWAYRTLCTGSVQSEAITLTKTAHLFSHNLTRLSGSTSALLLLHGEHSHPLTMLHLADIAEAQGRVVFSVYLPYDDHRPEDHRLLLKKSIDKIEQIITQHGGRLSHLLLAGHSRGAIEAANEAFVKNNPKINGVIAIAGRFQVIKPSLRPCRKSLEGSVNAVWESLCNGNNLQIPFYQIAATHDWCIDPEASIVRQDQEHLSVRAGHLGVINHPDTLRQFKAWVAV
jgi:predicted esterase